MLALWLAASIGTGIAFVGPRFLINPAVGAAGFGVSVPPSDAYLRAKGVRDVASGLFVFGLLFFGWYRPLSVLLGVSTLIPIGDFITVLAYRRRGPTLPLAIHGATALCIAAVAAFLWHSQPS